MSAGIKGVDHPVIAVAEFEAAREAYERLGFTVPPRGRHLEWGTGNWCIMFPDDYLELRGIVDASQYTHGLHGYLSRRGQGLMGLAFAPETTVKQSEAQMRASDLRPAGIKQLTRRFQHAGGETYPRFSILYLDEAELPELLTSVICEHLTPELIRRPEYLEHANGAERVASVSVVVDDPPSLRQRYRRFFGEGAVRLEDGALVIQPAMGARIEFVAPARARVSGVLIGAASTPKMSAATLDVRDVGQVQKVLAGAGTPFESLDDGRVRVGEDQACGVTLLFQQKK